VSCFFSITDTAGNSKVPAKLLTAENAEIAKKAFGFLCVLSVLGGE
jgi:hypothetical protein